MEAQKQIADLITELGLTMTATRIPARPDKTNETPEDKRWAASASHYLIVIKRGGNGTGKGPEVGALTTFYSMGSAHKKPPRLAEVLDNLASDASGYDNARSFEDWAADYGYDTDSRKAEGIYKACAEGAKALRHLMGEHYDTLLGCERL